MDTNWSVEDLNRFKGRRKKDSHPLLPACVCLYGETWTEIHTSRSGPSAYGQLMMKRLNLHICGTKFFLSLFLHLYSQALSFDLNTIYLSVCMSIESVCLVGFYLTLWECVHSYIGISTHELSVCVCVLARQAGLHFHCPQETHPWARLWGRF